MQIRPTGTSGLGAVEPPSTTGDAHGPLEQDLQDRLAILTAKSYVDPARRDLTRVDFIGLLVLDLALVTLMLLFAWG